VRVFTRHRNPYFRLEVDGTREDDPLAPGGRISDRLARFVCSDRKRDRIKAEAGGYAE